MIRTQLHTRVLHEIGQSIVDRGRPPGHVVQIDELTADYGVSRSVAREAMRVLEAAGMVSVTKKVGIRIQDPSSWQSLDPLIIRWRINSPARDTQLKEITQLRSAVEPIAARLAAQRSDVDGLVLLEVAYEMREVGRRGDLERFLELDVVFHSQLVSLSGNELFAGLDRVIIEGLSGRTKQGLMPDRPSEDAMQWHIDVAQAIVRGSADSAEQSMRQIMTLLDVELGDGSPLRPK